MSLGAPRNALAAVAYPTGTGGQLQGPAVDFGGGGGRPGGGGNWGWQPDALNYGLGTPAQPQPYIALNDPRAFSYSTSNPFGFGMWIDPLSQASTLGWQQPRTGGSFPLPAGLMPRTGGPMQGPPVGSGTRSNPLPGPGGSEADRLNALVLAALQNQPAQQNNSADANIRRFMGIG